MRVQIPPCPILFILLLAALQLAAFPGQWLGAEGDEALYVLLSRSLLAGRYGLEVVPGDPAYVQVTPGWPLLLAPAAALSGDSPLGYQVLAYLALAACDLLAYAWLRRRLGPRGALVLTALFALNPLVLSRSGVVMPELPGLALALGAVLLVERGSGPFLLGAVLAAAYLVRPATLPLVPACAAALWLRGRRREALQAAAVPAAAALAWWYWTRRAGGFSDLGEGLQAVSGSGWSAWPGAFLYNVRAALTLWGQTLIPTGQPGAAALGLGAALAGLALAGTARRLRRGPDAAALYLAGSVALHLAWPWWYERYLAALLPFALAAAWDGARASGLGARPAIWGAAILVLAPLPLQAPAVVARSRAAPPLSAAYGFLARLPPGLAASVFYPRDAWYSGRPFVPLLRHDGPPPRVRWVLWEEGWDTGSSLGGRFPAQARIEAWRRRLEGPGYRLVHRNGTASVYEVTKVTVGRP